MQVTFDNPMVLSAPADRVSREFTWEYGGVNWVWNVSIPQRSYQIVHDKPRPRTNDYSVYVTYDKDDYFFSSLGNALRAEGEKLGFDGKNSNSQYHKWDTHKLKLLFQLWRKSGNIY